MAIATSISVALNQRTHYTCLPSFRCFYLFFFFIVLFFSTNNNKELALPSCTSVQSRQIILMTHAMLRGVVYTRSMAQYTYLYRERYSGRRRMTLRIRNGNAYRWIWVSHLHTACVFIPRYDRMAAYV